MPPKKGKDNKGKDAKPKSQKQGKPPRQLYPGEVVMKPQGASHAAVEKAQAGDMFKK
jgi:hypothetical protein